MQPDDHYFDTDHSYTYPMDAGQSHHTGGVPNFYELGRLTGLESPLPTPYTESHRGDTHATQYAMYDSSTSFHGDTYRLSEQSPFSAATGGPFNDHLSVANELHHFSQPSVQHDLGALRNPAGNLYEPMTSLPEDIMHTYLPDFSLTHTSQLINVYGPVPLPSVTRTAGRVAATISAQQSQTSPRIDGFVPEAPFDHKYTRSLPINKPGQTNLANHQGPFSAASHRTGTSCATAPDDPVHPPVAVAKKKKSKMHDCEICGKKFPRPSGLRTHMNTHNNVKPYPCSFPGCARSFAVRSNAKRHLRTHGIIPAPAPPSSSLASSSKAAYVVGFSPPTIVQEPEGAGSHQMRTIKWMPVSLSTRTNASSLRSISEAEESDGEEEDDDHEGSPMPTGLSTGEGSFHLEDGQGSSRNLKLNRSGRLALSIPLRAVMPTPPLAPRCAPLNLPFSLCGANSECYARHEERDSFRETGSHPYHPSQFRSLPGPAICRPSLMV